MESEMPLFGKSVLVTRGKKQAAEFSRKISTAGGIPIEIPLLAFQKPKSQQMIIETIENLDTYDWLVFTSKNGVDYFFDFYHKVEKASNTLPKIAVVGTKTQKALQEIGIEADLVPEEFVAEGLLESLVPLLRQGERFLLARGNLSRTFLVEELTKLGVEVTDLIVYETVENSGYQVRLVELLKENHIDIITFTSPSTVSQFYKIVKNTEWRTWTNETIFACIGPQTETAAKKHQIPIHVCPNTYTIDHLLEEIISYVRNKEE